MGKGRILIVDDDEALVKPLSGLLCDEGFNVFSTTDGREALTLVRIIAPAVILLDVWLPGMDGVEILQALQAAHADVEVIVMSGHGNIATAVHMTKLGAFDYLEGVGFGSAPNPTFVRTAPAAVASELRPPETGNTFGAYFSSSKSFTPKSEVMHLRDISGRWPMTFPGKRCRPS